MSIKKRLMAAILTIVMVIGMAVTSYAAGVKSGETAPEETCANKTFSLRRKYDNNQQDHNKECIVRTRVTDSAAVVHDVTHAPGKRPGNFAALTLARDKDNNKRAITHIGNAQKGVFDSQKGRCITSVTIGTSQVTVSTKAFEKSKVNILRIKSQKVIIRANAFKGTNNTAMKIYLIPPTKQAKDWSFATGAFNGLSKNSRITVLATAMSKTEFEKLKKKLTKAGYLGRVIRK